MPLPVEAMSVVVRDNDKFAPLASVELRASSQEHLQASIEESTNP